MKLLKATFVGILLLTLPSLTSCNAMNRAGKDLYITAISPLLIPYAGATDAAADAKEIKKAVKIGPLGEIISFPVYFTWHLVHHTFSVTLYALDLIMTPAWVAADLHPHGPEITTIDYYTGTWFDEPEKKGGTDFESGEKTDR